MYSIRNIYFTFFLGITLVIIGSCSSSKKAKAKKNSPITRAYHDITSHYNYYFNARSIYKEKLKSLAVAPKDNYDEVLSVYAVNSETAKSASSDMENVFKKSSIALQLHPTSKWVDDEYLLMGKAHYMKGEYDKAIETFQFINGEFKNGNKLHKYKFVKKKTKVKKKDDGVPQTPDYTKAKDYEEIKKEEAEKPVKKKPTKKKKPAKKKKPKKPSKKKKPTKKPSSSNTKSTQTKPSSNSGNNSSTPKTNSSNNTNNANTNKSPNTTNTKPEDKDPKEKKDLTKDLALKINLGSKSAKMITYTLADSTAAAAAEKAEQKKGLIYKLKHKPVANEALVWLGRSFVDSKKYTEAETVFSHIKNDPTFPKKLLGEFNNVLADYYLERQDYTNAKAAVSKAAEYTKNKKQKARLHFVAAQLYEKEKDYKKARANYAACIKNKPEYEMQFHAMLNNTLIGIKDQSRKPEQVLASLKNMSKETKNAEYLDQIFMSMADIAIAQKQPDKAIVFLKEGIKAPSFNPNIKGRLFNKIADIYFAQEQYPLAYAYYDSTLSQSVNNLELAPVKERHDILKNLVANLNVLQYEDSLQALTKMSKAELDDFIEELMDKAEKAKADAETDAQAPNNKSNSTPTNNTTVAGQWYFYNMEAKSKGYNEFVKKWGNRPNSDGWRRSSKAVIASNNDPDPNTSTLDIDKKIASGTLKKSDILNALPNSPEKKKISDDKIIVALYAIGGIYDYQLKNNKKAISNLDRLVTQYPKCDPYEPALYQLYLLCNKERNVAKAGGYANTLKSEFPSGSYTKLIDNPNYVSSETRKNNSMRDFYEQTYELYRNEKYNEVIQRKIEADSLYKLNPWQPKLEMVYALSLGKSSNIDSMKIILESIVKRFPTDEVKPEAEKILLQLKKSSNNKPDTSKAKTLDTKEKDKDKKTVEADKAKENNTNDSKVEDNKMFKYNKNEKHFVAVVLQSKGSNITQALAKITDYNTANHSASKFVVTQIMLDKDRTILMIKDFKDIDKAKNYSKVLQTQTELWKAIPDAKQEIYPMSISNFSTLLKTKDTEQYNKFVAEYYK